MRARTFFRRWILVAFLALNSELAKAEEPSSSVEQDVMDAFAVAAIAQTAVAETVITTGVFPKDRKAAGMRDAFPDPSYFPVESIKIFDGIVVVTFSEKAHSILIGKSFFLLPSLRDDGSVKWVCTVARPKGIAATPVPVDTPLPGRCRSE